VLAGSQGDPAIGVLRIEAPAFATSFITVALIFGLLSLHEHRALLTATVVGVGSLGALTLALAGAHGAMGVGLAVSVADTILLITLAWLLKRSQPDFRPWTPVLAPVALAAGWALSLMLIPELPDVIRVLIGTLAYFGVLNALDSVPAELRTAIRPSRT
jgi:O-antigen/teichoic acid export membrane protein